MITSCLQSIPPLSLKDLKAVIGIPNLSKHIQTLSVSHDMTAFINLILSSCLKESQISLVEVFKLLKGCINLKIAYTLIESMVYLSMGQSEAVQERCHEILTLVKENNNQEFSQAVLYLLKQSSNNEAIFNLLQGKKNALVSKFGDKEYSLLSSLASSSKVTKLTALDALLNKQQLQLTANEKALIKISLAQLIWKNSEETSILQKVLAAFVNQIDMTIVNDSDFDVLEEFINSNISY